MWNDIVINYWAVIAGGVISMITGMFWYGFGFGKTWMRLSGHTPEEGGGKDVGKLYFWQFVASLVFTYVLAHFVQIAGATTWQAGATVGFWAWLGFLVAGGVGTYLFPPKSLALFAFDKGYQLVNTLIIAAVLVVW